MSRETERIILERHPLAGGAVPATVLRGVEVFFGFVGVDDIGFVDLDLDLVVAVEDLGLHLFLAPRQTCAGRLLQLAVWRGETVTVLRYFERLEVEAAVVLEFLVLELDVGVERLLHVPGEVLVREVVSLAAHEALQRFGELAGGLEPLLGRFRERLEHDVFELFGDVRVVERRRRHLDFADLLQRVEVALAEEQALEREQLVQHDPEREDVAAVVDVEAADLLRAHVAELALQDPDLRLRCLAGRLRDAEVDDLDLAFVRQQHVLR